MSEYKIYESNICVDGKFFIQFPVGIIFLEGNFEMVGVNLVPMVKSEVRLLKSRALKTGVWFRVLSRLDRALINAVLRVADKMRSPRLVEALVKVREKVEKSVGGVFTQAIFRVGLPLARRIGLLAKSWGNPYAEDWMSDLAFARFLAIMDINKGQKCSC
ncbi:MAG: hypothetical protein QXX79_01085 [Candidatus Bathyarchaeia archaeon]